MQFPFALVSFLPIPLSFAHYFSSSRLLTSFLRPCFTRVPSSPVSGLARGATWESEAHHRLGTRFRGSEQMPHHVFKRNHTVMDSALWDLST